MKKSLFAKLSILLLLVTFTVGMTSCERLGGGPNDGSQNGQPVTTPDPI